MVRIVVIGADAAGASAASTAKRLQPEYDVIMLERGQVTSYAACGLPYWVAGQIAERDQLIARTAEQHRANGIDVRLGHEAVSLDPSAGTVTVVAADGESVMPYDRLLIATGAEPVAPPIPGADAENVFTIHNVPGTAKLVDRLTATDRPPSTAVIVGAGYIGLEMAEAFGDHDIAVTIIDRAPTPMVTMDVDMGAVIADRMAAQGFDLALGQSIEHIELDSSGAARAVVTSAGRYPADVVVLALGVKPRTGLAAHAGLPLGDAGGLLTDRQQRVTGHENIWAAGDCTETYHRLLRRPVHVPLGTHANKQGRVAGANLGDSYLTFPGVIGTAITKVGTTHIARTGLTETQAAAEGFSTRAATVRTSIIAGYMPDAGQMLTKIVIDRSTGRILGGQIIGNQVGAAKRIDTLAMAVWSGWTALELSEADLAYAPPSSPVWDPVQTAARRVLSARS